MGQFTFKEVVESLRTTKRLLYISLEDHPNIGANVFYKRAYETSSASIFDILVNRPDKQLLDHVRPSLLMMQIRIARAAVKFDLI